jgi:hypothetical protein
MYEVEDVSAQYPECWDVAVRDEDRDIVRIGDYFHCRVWRSGLDSLELRVEELEEFIKDEVEKDWAEYGSLWDAGAEW